MAHILHIHRYCGERQDCVFSNHNIVCLCSLYDSSNSREQAKVIEIELSR